MRNDDTLPLELSIVVPTYCEHDNVAPLVGLLQKALPDVGWEVIFVDDNSSDGTSARAWELARTDRRIRCLRRVGRRGLSSACIEGMLSSGAPYLAVMDADLQHDPALLSEMLKRLKQGSADLVLASRYMPGGSVGDWATDRVRISSVATRLASLVTRQPVSDPMSGYFMLTRESFEAALPRLTCIGFKILLDIIASSPVPLRLAEVPLRFGKRVHGQSKLSPGVAWEFVLLLADKFLAQRVPVRFISFAFVGAVGALLHLATLVLVFKGLGASFAFGQGAGVAMAMVFNYSFNNLVTYGDRSLRGWAWWRGLVSFMAICSVGMLANVGVATVLFDQQTAWGLAAVAGMIVGSVWNFAVTSRYTWRG
jgi:dolichol-phosphate mannosyltransferase